MRRSIMAVIAITTCLAPFAAAQEAEMPAQRAVVTASENAALNYWPIWAEYTEDDWHRLRIQYVQGVPRDAKPDPNAAYLVEVSRLEHCDFAIDLTRGLGTNFVHVDMMHDLTSMLMVDAQIMLQNGKGVQAAERVAAAIRLCEHRTQNSLAISAGAAANRLDRIARFMVQHQREWNPEARKILDDALSRFNEDDPLRAREAILRETEWTRIAYLNEVDGGALDPRTVRRVLGQGLNALADVGGGIVGINNDVALAEFASPVIASANSDAQARALLKRAILLGERAMLQLADVWNSPTPDEKEAELHARIEADEFGPFAADFIRGVERLRPRSIETAELITALRAWASGETETLELPEEQNR